MSPYSYQYHGGRYITPRSDAFIDLLYAIHHFYYVIDAGLSYTGYWGSHIHGV